MAKLNQVNLTIFKLSQDKIVMAKINKAKLNYAKPIMVKLSQAKIFMAKIN